MPPYSQDPDGELPFVDEHQVLVSAPASAVWRALTTQINRSQLAGASAGAYGHLVAAEPRRASGNLPDEGATLPGFRVAEAVPGHLLRLVGRHRFSRHALVFTLVPQSDGTLLSARTDAEFPGLHGRVYRLLVIGSGGHRVLLGRLLHAVRRQAEGESSR
ncbi:hypothetical protein [Micromonospora sp. RTP1Z1]|uniref:hypothetical protein n=1 Tax=Micromonospora sp. RTP1Z1 TaxID=2994043 RepID=UPI0029C6A820|nr:hypothetical protein [Micromonospora sp. RTP1Z1]